MRLINESSRPTDEVRRLVGIGVKGLPHKGVKVRVIDARRRAWDGKIHCTGYGGRSVLIRIAPDSMFPYKGWRRHKSSPWNHDYQDWREAVVALAAHEMKHVEHVMRGMPNGHQGEMRCEAYERGVLDRYRLQRQVRNERDDHTDSDDD